MGAGSPIGGGNGIPSTVVSQERGVRVLTIEPYFGLSHRNFLEGYKRYSKHDVTIWPLPARKWKWRMRGSAYHFAEVARALPESESFDVLLVSDFLNLPDFLSIAPRRFNEIPRVAYFHENQITYPLGENAPVEHHYGWINLSTALAADRVLFNSYYHRSEFLREVEAVLDRMPDHVPENLVVELERKSRIFPVGMDFAEHDDAIKTIERRKNTVPKILWNHRWEYDKGPETFFRTMIELREDGLPFRLVVCGQSFKKFPEIFTESKQVLADRIDHFGFFPEYRSYLENIAACDIVVSTAVHEFFRVSVLDAIYAGCLPVLPRRLSYPEMIPPHLHPLFLYDRDEDLKEFLRAFLAKPPEEYRDELRESAATCDWRNLASDLDRELEALAGS